MEALNVAISSLECRFDIGTVCEPVLLPSPCYVYAGRKNIGPYQKEIKGSNTTAFTTSAKKTARHPKRRTNRELPPPKHTIIGRFCSWVPFPLLILLSRSPGEGRGGFDGGAGDGGFNGVRVPPLGDFSSGLFAMQAGDFALGSLGYGGNAMNAKLFFPLLFCD